jgi:hypothetical protein
MRKCVNKDCVFNQKDANENCDFHVDILNCDKVVRDIEKESLQEQVDDLINDLDLHKKALELACEELDGCPSSNHKEILSKDGGFMDHCCKYIEWELCPNRREIKEQCWKDYFLTKAKEQTDETRD